MKNLIFYSTFAVEENCIRYFKNHFKSKLTKCTGCGSRKLRWNDIIIGWKCSCCTKKISLKSISFMRDSNKSYSDWLEILHLVLNDKKPISVKGILRVSKQKRYGTVLYMVRKIQLELGKVNAKIKYTKISDLTFQGSKVNSINFPENLVICYNISSSRNRDEIRLLPPKELRYYTKALKMKLKSKTFLYPKLLEDSTIDELELMNYSEQKIKKTWKKKITGNIMRLLEGIHHEVAWYNLQFILDEYTFKYNLRYCEEWKVNLFLQELDVLDGRIVYT